MARRGAAAPASQLRRRSPQRRHRRPLSRAAGCRRRRRAVRLRLRRHRPGRDRRGRGDRTAAAAPRRRLRLLLRRARRRPRHGRTSRGMGVGGAAVRKHAPRRDGTDRLRPAAEARPRRRARPVLPARHRPARNRGLERDRGRGGHRCRSLPGRRDRLASRIGWRRGSAGSVLPNRDPGRGHDRLGLRDGVLGEVEDRRGEDGVGVARRRCRRRGDRACRRRRSRSPGRRRRHSPRGSASRSKPSRVPSRSIDVSRISPAPRTTTSSAHDTASRPVGIRPPCVKTSKPPDTARGIDGDDSALAPELRGDLAHELGASDGRRVHRDLVGAGAKQAAGVVDTADPAADGERDEHLLGGAAGDVEDRVAGVGRRRDVEEDELVGAFGVVAGGELDGSPASRRPTKFTPFHDAPGVDVEAGDHAGDAHGDRLLDREGALVQRAADDHTGDAVLAGAPPRRRANRHHRWRRGACRRRDARAARRTARGRARRQCRRRRSGSRRGRRSGRPANPRQHVRRERPPALGPSASRRPRDRARRARRRSRDPAGRRRWSRRDRDPRRRRCRARREPRRRRPARAGVGNGTDATTGLRPHAAIGEGGRHRGDDRAVHGIAGAGRVEVDDVDPAGTGIGERDAPGRQGRRRRRSRRRSRLGADARIARHAGRSRGTAPPSVELGDEVGQEAAGRWRRTSRGGTAGGDVAAARPAARRHRRSRTWPRRRDRRPAT